MTIDQQIDLFFKPLSDFLSSIIFFSIPIAGKDASLLLILLASAAVFFTVYLGFINFRYFFHAIDIVRGKFDRQEDDGEINSFQALMASMAGTIGLGNIAGVAVAISVGGPGAAFWMTVMGLLGMSSKFAEVTLGMKYRQHTDPLSPHLISGGPMYYLRDGLKENGLPRLGAFLAVLFAVCCVAGSIGGGNMFQANQAYQQVLNVTGGESSFLFGKGWLFGIGLAILTGAVILGGIQSIANVSSRLVPVMGLLYLLAGIIIVGINFHNIPTAFATIFAGAFSFEAGFGGFLGAVLVGVQRAAFSNEAGLGSAPIVYAAARARDPVTQGMASMLGPFIDTVIVCNITALMIVISGAYLDSNGMEGVQLTSRAMESGGSLMPYLLSVTVFLFAYSTLITWFYLGEKALTFLTGHRPAVHIGFKLFFCLCVVIGCATDLKNLISLTDAMILSAAFPNIIGLFILAPEIKKDLKAYLLKHKQSL
jgi:AGCS family alanine or glycine:cation symporter